MADKDDDADDEDDEDEDGDGDGDEGGASKGLRGNKKLIIIILASILLLVLVVAGGMYFSGFFNADQGQEEAGITEEKLDEENPDEVVDEEQSLKETSVEKTGSGEGEKKKSLITKGKFYHKFEDLNVNLVSSKRKPSYLRLSITVAVTKEEDVLVIENLSPRIIDNVIQYLSGLRPKEMAGTANFVRVQDNILLRIRTAVAPIVVTDALITLALVK